MAWGDVCVCVLGLIVGGGWVHGALVGEGGSAQAAYAEAWIAMEIGWCTCACHAQRTAILFIEDMSLLVTGLSHSLGSALCCPPVWASRFQDQGDRWCVV